jgi:two-component system chemotaxis response regulator CheV
VQGFLVGSVDRIFNTNWEDVMPPPRGTGRHNYMTAVTSVDGELVELIDVEKVLSEVQGIRSEVSAAVAAAAVPTDEPGLVLVVDDSMVARKQVARTLEQIGIPFQLANDGRQAAELLKSWAADPGPPVAQRVPMVISDIEMPEMDGYTLTKTIKDDPRLAGIYVLLHTSLSGVFNHVMVEKVGADRFVPKFNPDELAGAVLQRMRGGAVPARAAAG